MFFCKNCGQPYVTDEAVMCVHCGTSRGLGNAYCHSCGNQVAPDAMVCLKCGVATKTKVVIPGAKSKVVAGILAILLGSLGVHNFYLGFNQKAAIQLTLTIVGIVLSCIVVGTLICMGTAIWGVVDGVMILTDKMPVDAQGNPLSD